MHYLFFAVLADCLNALAVGAPLVPGFRIFSPDPAAMRFFFAAMLEYKPGFLAICYPLLWLRFEIRRPLATASRLEFAPQSIRLLSSGVGLPLRRSGPRIFPMRWRKAALRGPSPVRSGRPITVSTQSVGHR